MSLKVELKPGERIIIGTSVLRNGEQRVRFYIEGDAPILREKDILTPATADSPAKRIYLALQLMYLQGDLTLAEDMYAPLVKEFLGAAPSAIELVAAINNEVLSGELYRALKASKALIAYERNLLRHALRGRERLLEDSPGDAVAA